MGRRTVLLIAAALVAALGTGSVFAYVRGVDRRALAGQDPVRVLVATEPVRAGTSLAAAQRSGAFVVKELPRSAVAEGALSDLSSVGDRVVAGDMFPGEQLLSGKLAAAGALNSLPIPAGKVAMSVQLGDPERVAGFVTPGADVAVFATITRGTGATTTETTDLLLARVPVMAVGPTTLRSTDENRNTEELPTAILTLALTQHEATKLVHATQTGELYFALLTRESQVRPGGAVDTTSLFK